MISPLLIITSYIIFTRNPFVEKIINVFRAVIGKHVSAHLITFLFHSTYLIKKNYGNIRLIAIILSCWRQPIFLTSQKKKEQICIKNVDTLVSFWMTILPTLGRYIYTNHTHRHNFTTTIIIISASGTSYIQHLNAVTVSIVTIKIT